MTVAATGPAAGSVVAIGTVPRVVSRVAMTARAAIVAGSAGMTVPVVTVAGTRVAMTVAAIVRWRWVPQG